MNNAITTNNEHRIPWNEGKLIGQKSPTQAQRNLGHPYTLAIGRPDARIGNVQSGN